MRPNPNPDPAHEHELLAPAGDWDCVKAAVANGADAIYLGLERFNARLRAQNFGTRDLPEVVRFCHARGVRVYVALNVLIFTGELADAADELRSIHASGADALIVQDLGLARLARQAVPELRLHASTQMTITSPEGVRFAAELGVGRVVLSRELSLRELKKFPPILPLEVFVHGALCVAYSGQCLTSESLGRRSANRGECAQACRMPYGLVVDGKPTDLGARRFLLSPHDLAAADEIADLVELGITGFKIEGRLKSPEYVAAVTRVYRKAIDAALENSAWNASAEDRYGMEMTFSRGFFSGWLHGVNHQRLVSARYAKKRGPFVGEIARVGPDHVILDAFAVPLKPGDGIVFDTGGDTDQEQGGRIFQIDKGALYFRHDQIDFRKLTPGDRVWKTSDPALDTALRQSFSGKIPPVRHPVSASVSGKAGKPLRVTFSAQHPAPIQVSAESQIPLEEARTRPLTEELLREQLGRFGESPWKLDRLDVCLEGPVILPLSEINRLRRELVLQIDGRDGREPRDVRSVLDSMLANIRAQRSSEASAPELSLLCRTQEHIEEGCRAGVRTLYADFEDVRRYREAVALVRQFPGTALFLATPRIQKAGEEGFFKLIAGMEPDGVLIRNLGGIEFFAETDLRRVGDFSLNVANPLTAELLIARGLERVTISYDLNEEQVLGLLEAAPPSWFELTLHQHMPMFHMEHCVFAAFLSEGTDHTNCGRPCDTHRVHLRDRVGIDHPVRADVGCRNTLFNAVAQTGALHYARLRETGLSHFRVELLEEDAEQSRRIIAAYQALLAGERSGNTLWKELRAQSQLGVTRGTLEESGFGPTTPRR